jgi:hypothetical protein
MKKLTLDKLKPGKVYLYMNRFLSDNPKPIYITYLRHFYLSDYKYILVTTQGDLSYDDVWFELFEVN